MIDTDMILNYCLKQTVKLIKSQINSRSARSLTYSKSTQQIHFSGRSIPFTYELNVAKICHLQMTTDHSPVTVCLEGL